MVTQNELKQAYDEVSVCTMAVYNAGVKFELIKEKVEKEVLNATFKGEIQGKNEGERKAIAAQMFEEDYETLATSELTYKNLSNELSLAQIHLNFVRDCIRVEELAK